MRIYPSNRKATWVGFFSTPTSGTKCVLHLAKIKWSFHVQRNEIEQVRTHDRSKKVDFDHDQLLFDCICAREKSLFFKYTDYFLRTPTTGEKCILCMAESQYSLKF